MNDPHERVGRMRHGDAAERKVARLWDDADSRRGWRTITHRDEDIHDILDRWLQIVREVAA